MPWSLVRKFGGSQRPNHNLSGATNAIASANDISGPVTELDALWKVAMQCYVSRLAEKDRKTVIIPAESHAPNQQMLEKLLNPIRTKYTQDRFYQCLARINPVVNHIRSFAVVVDVATQANANPTSLIWGCVRLLLEVCYRGQYKI